MRRTDRQEQTFGAVIFDLDGVVTRTARLHAAAWKQLFDSYLAQRDEAHQPFDAMRTTGVSSTANRVMRAFEAF